MSSKNLIITFCWRKYMPSQTKNELYGESWLLLQTIKIDGANPNRTVQNKNKIR